MPWKSPALLTIMRSISEKFNRIFSSNLRIFYLEESKNVLRNLCFKAKQITFNQQIEL